MEFEGALDVDVKQGYLFCLLDRTQLSLGRAIAVVVYSKMFNKLIICHHFVELLDSDKVVVHTVYLALARLACRT